MDGNQTDHCINSDNCTNQWINRLIDENQLSDFIPTIYTHCNSAVNIQTFNQVNCLFLTHGGSSRQRTLISARGGSE